MKTLTQLVVLTLILLSGSEAFGQGVGLFSRLWIDQSAPNTGGCRIDTGAGTPEGTVVGRPCDIFIRTDGGGASTTVYVKGTGTDTNTGWVAIPAGAGGGTVTSVALTVPSIFSVSGSPVTTSGTLGVTFNDATANFVLAGPTTGAAATPSFRALVAADIPPVTSTMIQNATIAFVDWANNGCAEGEIPKLSGGVWACGTDAGASSGAPAAAQYVTLATDATLTNERVLTAGTGISLTDGGAGSTITIANLGILDPGTPTDEALVRFDGTTGTAVQNSTTTLSDAGAFSFVDNVRQTFNPGADAAGLNVGSLAGDPATPVNGDLWYDSSANELTARINGSDVALGAGGGGGAPTDAQYVTLATNGTLSNERVLTAGSGITLTDGGAGSTITVALQHHANIAFTLDGGGSALTTGWKTRVRVPYSGTILKATVLSCDETATTGSIVLDVWKDSYANFPPTNADSITASAKPTLSSANKSEDATLTGWTTSFAEGDIFDVEIESVSTLTCAQLLLRARVP